MHMKMLITAFVFLFTLQSCDSNTSKVDGLKTKVTILEHRVDSLIHTLKKPGNTYKNAVSNTNSRNIYGTTNSTTEQKKKVMNSGQCMATTQKGHRCSRRTRSAGYCWQHGG